MSSPGAGKTTLLRETRGLGGRAADRGHRGRHRDQPRRRPAAGFGAAVELVNTGNGFGGECHLDATDGSRRPSAGCRCADSIWCVIENVGNLVCPAEFDVGKHARAMVYAVTEGEDKPLKYPVMFRSSTWSSSTRSTCCPTSTSTWTLRRQPARGEPRRPTPVRQRPHRRGRRRLVRLAARPAARPVAAQRVRRGAGASTCEPARASVSAAVIMSAACPAAASASITSVTQSSASRPSSGVSCPSCAGRPGTAPAARQLRQAGADELRGWRRCRGHRPGC